MSRELDTNFKAEKSEAPAENTFNQTTPISQSDQKLLLGIISEQQNNYGVEKLPPLTISDSEGTLIAGGTGGNKECRRFSDRDARQGLCNATVDAYKFTKPATDGIGRGVDAGRRVFAPFVDAQREHDRAIHQRNNELQRRSVEAARERAEFNKTNPSAESRALHRYEQIQNAKRRR